MRPQEFSYRWVRRGFLYVIPNRDIEVLYTPKPTDRNFRLHFFRIDLEKDCLISRNFGIFSEFLKFRGMF